jgi:hypothetical protein
MPYVTYRSHWMQKHKFGVMCHGALFMEITPSPPKHEKYYVDISRSRRSGLPYVNRRSQKHKFGITCVGTLFVESVSVPPEHEK